jgi:hypothetical protein
MGVIRLLILSLLLAWPAAAQLGVQNPFYVAGLLNASVAAGSGDACGSCTNETFEGTGYSVAGWTEAVNGGIVNEDYTTAPAPLNGSQSLLIKDPADSQSSYTYMTMPSGTTELWMRGMLRITNTVVNGAGIVFIANNAVAIQCAVEIRASAAKLVAGTGNATSVATFSADTLYYWWFHYKKVAGANNDQADFAFSTSKTRPTSGNNFVSLTNGSVDGNAELGAVSVRDVDFASILCGIIFDDVSLTQLGQIGDFP